MPEPSQLTTTLGRTWKIKTAIFAVALLGLGLWGAYDALVVYPARGRASADFALQDYLETVRSASGGGTPVFTRNAAQISVADPQAEYARLTGLQDDNVLGQPGYENERARLSWLEALSRVNSLASLKAENDAELARRAADPTARPQPTTTLFVDLYQRYDEIVAKNMGRNRPSPLNAFDIPLQFLFMIVGFAGFLYMVVFFVRVNRKTFRYDPHAKRLTMPDGRSFTPDDLETVDKRKWDKYLVFITLKDGSPEIKLDLYRYDPLETWILEIERLSPGYEPVVEEGEAIVCVDVQTGAPMRLIPAEGTTLPAPNDAGIKTIYPATRTVSGEWFVVGASARAGLRQRIESGELSRSSVKVDPKSFRVNVPPDLDTPEPPERDLRPREAREDEGELEQVERSLATPDDSLT